MVGWGCVGGVGVGVDQLATGAKEMLTSPAPVGPATPTMLTPPTQACRCRIGQRSFDGFGHQLESKLTCIAAARALGADYVHIRFAGKAHGENVSDFESFLEFAHLYPVRSAQHTIQRQSSWATWPFPRACRFCLNRANLSRTCSESYYSTKKPSWLRRLETDAPFRTAKCCGAAAASHVMYADNCYDLFNCHPDWPGIWDRVALSLRRHYKAVAKPRPQWFERVTPRVEWGAKVALHVRLGDVAERALPPGYFARAVQALRAEQLSAGGAPPLFRFQTNGREADSRVLLRQPGLRNASDVFIDHSKYFLGEASQRSSLVLTVHRLVTADYLIMSRSALSMVAALLSEGSVFFPACWTQFRRPLPSWRLWPCCANETELVKGGNCQSEGRKARWPVYKSKSRETQLG